MRNVSAHCHDNVEGHRSAAQDMPDPSLKIEFQGLVQCRTAFAQALSELASDHLPVAGPLDRVSAVRAAA